MLSTNIPIGNICKKICSGGTPKSTIAEYYDGDIPWLNTKEIDFNRIYTTEKKITELGLKNSSAKWILPNTIAVAMYGATAGKVAIVMQKMTTNQACCNLMIDESLADYRYVYYALSSRYSELASLANGGAQQNLSAQIIKNFEIPLPELATQRKIAAVLSSLDDKIELNAQINHNLEEQAKAIFKSWFVDFEPFQGGKFVDSELGKIPKGWQILSFTEIILVQGGGTPKTSILEYWNGDIPFFTPKDTGSATYTLVTEKNITQDGLNNCNSPLYPANTVFVTARGTVGKVALAGRSMAMNQSCYALVGKNLPSYFVYHLALHAVESLKVKASGAVFDAIVTRDFDSEKIVSPPKDVIMAFIDKVKPFYDQILCNELQNNSFTAMRDSLLPKLMSGEIDVSEVEI